MKNTQELPITAENIANLKVGDEILVGISREKSHWLTVEDSDEEGRYAKSRINWWTYDVIKEGVLHYLHHRNSALDIHAIRKAVVIPEGWTKYDPDVLPPEDAEYIEMMYDSGNTLVRVSDWFTCDWHEYKYLSHTDTSKCTMYRVTKWKTKSAD